MDMTAKEPFIFPKKQTIDYIENLPEGQRAELINGRVYDMAAPSDMHQELVSDFTRTIGNYILDNHGNCKVRPAPYAVYLNKDRYNYVEPDISVICQPEKIDEKGCHGAPDWIIEIASPSSMKMDYMIKLLAYKAAGVREYWIVNPDKRTVNTYFFDGENGTGVFTFDDPIQVSIYPDLTINVADIIM